MFDIKCGYPKNFEAPAKGRGRPNKYPFNKMSVGTYFEVPASMPESSRVKSAATAYGNKNQMEFVVETTKNGSAKVFRIG